MGTRFAAWVAALAEQHSGPAELARLMRVQGSTVSAWMYRGIVPELFRAARFAEVSGESIEAVRALLYEAKEEGAKRVSDQRAVWRIRRKPGSGASGAVRPLPEGADRPITDARAATDHDGANGHPDSQGTEAKSAPDKRDSVKWRKGLTKAVPPQRKRRHAA